MKKRLLVGTRNPSRIDLVQKILQHTGIQVLTLEDLCILEVVDEDQSTTASNAEKKARGYFAFAQIPTLAMDGGLHVERFPAEKQPGVQVKRVVTTTVQPDIDVLEVMNYYKQALAEVGGESPGTWTGSHALAVSEDRVLVSSFTFQVLFTIKHRGEPQPGLSLDPLMIDPASGRYYTEIPVEERPYFRHIKDFLMNNITLL